MLVKNSMKNRFLSKDPRAITNTSSMESLFTKERQIQVITTATFANNQAMTPKSGMNSMTTL